MMGSSIFPPEILTIILSFLEDPADLAVWARVNRFWHLEAARRLWRGDYFGIKNAQEAKFVGFPETAFLAELSIFPERLRHYTRFAKLLHLGHGSNETASSRKQKSFLWDAKAWVDCNPWALVISSKDKCRFENRREYPFLKASLRAFIKNLVKKHDILHDNPANYFEAEDDNPGVCFWSTLSHRCLYLEYLVIPADTRGPGSELLLEIATNMKMLKLVTLIMTDIRTLHRDTVPEFLNNPNLLSFCVGYKESQIVPEDILTVRCTGLRVLRIPVDDLEMIERLLRQLRLLECVHIMFADPLDEGLSEEDIVSHIFEPLKEMPNLVSVNLRNTYCLQEDYKGGNTLAHGDEMLLFARSCPQLRSIEIELWDDFDIGISETLLQQVAATLPSLENLHLGLIDPPSVQTLASIAQSCPLLRELHLHTHPFLNNQPTDLLALWGHLEKTGVKFPSLETIHAYNFTWPGIGSGAEAKCEDHRLIDQYVQTCRKSMPALLNIDILYNGQINPYPPYHAGGVVQLFGEALRKSNPKWIPPTRSYASRYETQFADDLLQSLKPA